jgi:hypothetical protein
MIFMSIMAAPGVFIIFTTTGPMAGNGGNIILGIDEGLPIGIGKQAVVSDSIPRGRFKEETNFGKMGINGFTTTRMHLFNDRESLTITLSPVREDKISNWVLKEISSEESLAQVNVSGVLPKSRCKAEMNFEDMETRDFAVSQLNLFNHKELLAITLAPGREGLISSLALNEVLRQENSERANDCSKEIGPALSGVLGREREIVSPVTVSSAVAKAREGDYPRVVAVVGS